MSPSSETILAAFLGSRDPRDIKKAAFTAMRAVGVARRLTRLDVEAMNRQLSLAEQARAKGYRDTVVQLLLPYLTKLPGTRIDTANDPRSGSVRICGPGVPDVGIGEGITLT